MNLILVEPHELADGGRLMLTGAHALHVRSVLKAVPGSAIRVGILDGPAGAGTIEEITDESVRVTCSFADHVPERPLVDLLLALPRPKVLRRLWAQLSALGIGRILLTNAARVERNYFYSHFLDERVYRPLLIEGLQQARDTRVPVVTVHRQLKVLLEDHLDGMAPESTRVFGDPGSGVAVATAVRPSHRRVLLAVGPEGGWTDYERQLLARCRFDPVSMGPRSLRSDTACVALLTLVHAALADSASP